MLERFAEKMQWLRTKRGITQKQLAAELGVGKSHINQIESGKRRPGAELVFKVADFFDVSADLLVRDELDLEEK
jgi:transcriptional regulator with XRE-family HTH domain